jgi:hypothetical protein
MRIDITATDRDGRILETRSVEGPSFHHTYEARGEVYDYFREAYRNYMGLPPYIFTNTVYNP